MPLWLRLKHRERVAGEERADHQRTRRRPEQVGALAEDERRVAERVQHQAEQQQAEVA